jgi:Sec-independent protein translocase protein TatA
MRITAEGETGLGSLPLQIFDAVKDNVVVQWFMVVVVILIVGTQTAEKLSGPVGKVARWARSIGEGRENREAEARRAARQRLLREGTTESQEYLLREVKGLKEQVGELFDHRDKMDKLINAHMGWDYQIQQDLIRRGVQPTEIPTPPPLRVPWGTPTRAEKATAQEQADIEAARDGDVVGASD